MNGFGQLVNWESSSLDGLEYSCLCCNPTEDVKGMGLNGFGMRPCDVGPGQASRSQGMRMTEGSGPKIDASKIAPPSTNLAAPFIPTKNPGRFLEREATYDAIRGRREAELASKPAVPTEVTLPDGTVLGSEYNLTFWRTSHLDVARCMSDGLANVAAVS